MPPARMPIEDISRERIDQVLDGGVTRPEELPPALVALRLEWINAGGHGALRHDYTRAGEDAQRDRCTLGHDPITGNRIDWETGNDHNYGRDASAFTTGAALVYAEARLWNRPEAAEMRQKAEDDERVAHRVEVEAMGVLGSNFRSYVQAFERLGSASSPTGSAQADFSEDSKVFALYQRARPDSPWFLYTIYPKRS